MSMSAQEPPAISPIPIPNWNSLIQTISGTRVSPEHVGTVLATLQWRGDIITGAVYSGHKRPLITVTEEPLPRTSARQLRIAIAHLVSANHTQFIVQYSLQRVIWKAQQRKKSVQS